MSAKFASPQQEGGYQPTEKDKALVEKINSQGIKFDDNHFHNMVLVSLRGRSGTMTGNILAQVIPYSGSDEKQQKVIHNGESMRLNLGGREVDGRGGGIWNIPEIEDVQKVPRLAKIRLTLNDGTIVEGQLTSLLFPEGGFLSCASGDQKIFLRGAKAARNGAAVEINEKARDGDTIIRNKNVKSVELLQK